MITLYYIGGPWDLTKRVLPAEPARVITVRASQEYPEFLATNPEGLAEIHFKDHHYLTRQIARETFIAVHESIQT